MGSWKKLILVSTLWILGEPLTPHSLCEEHSGSGEGTLRLCTVLSEALMEAKGQLILPSLPLGKSLCKPLGWGFGLCDVLFSLAWNADGSYGVCPSYSQHQRAWSIRPFSSSISLWCYENVISPLADSFPSLTLKSTYCINMTFLNLGLFSRPWI